MEKEARSSEKPPKGGWITSLIHLIVDYYAELISQPFRSGLVYFFAGLIPALFVGWILFPMALYSEQEQPVKFNHAIHIMPDIGIDGESEIERCMFCHGFREDGTFVGIPKLAKCMECHDDPEAPFGEDPEEERFLKEYVAKDKEIEWLSYSRQPDCVYFSHVAHVKMGKEECGTCHGDLGHTETLPLYKQNRLSGYSIDIWGRNITGYKTNTWDRMKMDDCAECHTRTGHEEDNACFVCHK